MKTHLRICNSVQPVLRSTHPCQTAQAAQADVFTFTAPSIAELLLDDEGAAAHVHALDSDCLLVLASYSMEVFAEVDK